MAAVPLLAITCRACDEEVPLTPGEVLLWLLPAGPHPSGRAGSYAFLCAGCNDLIVRPADVLAVHLLRTAGVVPLGEAGSSASSSTVQS